MSELEPTPQPSGGDAAPSSPKVKSFSELDETIFDQTAQDQAVPQEEETSDETGDSTPDPDQPGELGETDDGDLESGDEEATEDGDEESAGEEVEPKAKVKAKVGDSEVEYDGEAVIPTKVNGVLEEPTLQELRDSWSGKQALGRDYQKFKQEVQQRDAHYKSIDQKITPVWKALQEGKITEAFISLAQQRGKSRLEVSRALEAHFAPIILQKAQMSEEQRKLYEQDEELSFYREEQAGKRKREADTALEAQIAAQTRQAQAQFGISDEEMGDAIEYLATKKYSGDHSKLTLQETVNTVMKRRTVDRACDALEAVSEKLLDDEKLVDAAVEFVTANPKIPHREVVKWVRSELQKRPATKKTPETLMKDISRRELEKRPKSSFESPKTAQKKPMSFGDIGEDELM